MTYNPDYIDDREYHEIRRQEQETISELKWRINREINATRDLCEQIRELIEHLEIDG